MGNTFFEAWSSQRLETLGPGVGLFIILVVVWSLYWKGRALWRAAHNEDRGWFIAILLINTVGILEIFYLYVISKKPTISEKKV